MSDREATRVGEKFARMYSCGFLTFEEHAYNFTLHAVAQTDDDMPDFVSTIPDEALNSYVHYLDGYLVAVDFMPDPAPFLVSHEAEEVQRKQRELRPKYHRLFALVRQRAERS